MGGFARSSPKRSGGTAAEAVLGKGLVMPLKIALFAQCVIHGGRGMLDDRDFKILVQ
jgi:hypothetical protein